MANGYPAFRFKFYNECPCLENSKLLFLKYADRSVVQYNASHYDGRQNLLNKKSRLMKIALTTPLALGLVFGLTGCTSEAEDVEVMSTPPASDFTLMSDDVKKNIEKTLTAGAKWQAENEDWVYKAIASAHNDEAIDTLNLGKEVQGLEALFSGDEESGLIESSFYNSTSVVPGYPPPSLFIFTQLQPVVTLGLANQFTEGPFTVKVDPTGFKKMGDMWVPFKDGAIVFIDKNGRYTGFSKADSTLALTPDGKHFSLKNEWVGEKPMDAEERLYNDLTHAVNLTENWLDTHASEKDEGPLDLSSRSAEIFKNAEFESDITATVTGNSHRYTLVGTETNTGNTGTYDSVSGWLDFKSATPDPTEVIPMSLYNEYVEAPSRVVADESLDLRAPGVLDTIVKEINNNTLQTNVKWSIVKDGKTSTVVASLDGKEYKFRDITTGQ